MRRHLPAGIFAALALGLAVGGWSFQSCTGKDAGLAGGKSGSQVSGTEPPAAASGDNATVGGFVSDKDHDPAAEPAGPGDDEIQFVLPVPLGLRLVGAEALAPATVAALEAPPAVGRGATATAGDDGHFLLAGNAPAGRAFVLRAGDRAAVLPALAAGQPAGAILGIDATIATLLYDKIAAMPDGLALVTSGSLDLPALWELGAVAGAAARENLAPDAALTALATAFVQANAAAVAAHGGATPALAAALTKAAADAIPLTGIEEAFANGRYDARTLAKGAEAATGLGVVTAMFSAIGTAAAPLAAADRTVRAYIYYRAVDAAPPPDADGRSALAEAVAALSDARLREELADTAYDAADVARLTPPADAAKGSGSDAAPGSGSAAAPGSGSDAAPGSGSAAAPGSGSDAAPNTKQGSCGVADTADDPFTIFVSRIPVPIEAIANKGGCATCDTAAAAAGLPVGWCPFLSDYPAIDLARISCVTLATQMPVYNNRATGLGGPQLAYDAGAFGDLSHRDALASVLFDERGEAVPPAAEWVMATGFTAQAVGGKALSDTCRHWTGNTRGNADAGETQGGDATGASPWFGGKTVGCDALTHLICLRKGALTK